ncbi:ubiquitin carboxyl-terminal hydrolase, putative [Trichoderma parareesei]|uniref:ubiquitinyl hydrolase 1 n=1 Tax=Trichoderma parareesei TaxID=858221 RepID=A0A2H2Z1T2_TRIPA|nr:ubiquitin carboxyl-terminal hydrolase, putative [Trichoderma parareesei]
MSGGPASALSTPRRRSAACCVSVCVQVHGHPHRLSRQPAPAASPPELPGQLTVKTSSSKKRKLARPLTIDLDAPTSPSPDTAIPSCEPDDDAAALSFSATPIASGLEAPLYVRAGSVTASSVPPRLQTQAQAQIASSLVSADYASSVASSPGTSFYPEPSIDSERGGDDASSVRTYARSQSPFLIPRKVLVNGDADLPQRSSSPLKRRASSMDPETIPNKNGDAAASAGDVEMTSSSHPSAELPRAMSVDVEASDSKPLDNNGADAAAQSAPPPPLIEQVKIIEMLLKASAEKLPQEGDQAYIVSRTWVDKALSLRSGKVDEAEISLGPVDNTDIIEEVIQEPGREDFVRLKPGLDQQSFELFPEDAWKLVMDWYGMVEGQKPIVRTAINTAADAQSPTEVVYELHPPIFRVHRLWSVLSPLPIEQTLKAENPPPLALVRSRKSHAQTFIKDIKRLSGIPIDRKVRLWLVDTELLQAKQAPAKTTAPAKAPALLTTPPDSPGRDEGSNGAPESGWSHLLVDLATFGSSRDARRVARLEDHTVNPNYNGSASIQLFDLVTDQTLIVDELVSKGLWVSTCTSRSLVEKAIPTRTNDMALSKPLNNRTSPSSSEGPTTRGRMQKKRNGRSVGAVGLHNLGNTCYMNSALQCVRSVEELTKYFLTDAYASELNKTNPLGYNGRVAMAYGSLLREIYDEGRGSVSPRDFKNTVGRCRSTFAGWGQQDSQEFLGFLLDALQEDLSRIKKKPYIEKPDSTDDMINNPEAIKEMADKVWDITRKRDDSVIADLFTGMYKSTLKCPECGKISITFDPFNNLTLPLPVENMWSKTVKFFPLNDVPVMFEVELPKHSSIEALKSFLSIRTGVPPNRLMGAEEFKDRFFKIYDNSGDVSEEIGANDIATFHELEAVPTNWPAKGYQKKPRSMLDLDDTPAEATEEWNDPKYDTMVVPVLHRRPYGTGKVPEGTSPPHFITLTRQEASSYDMIKRKVLERVATFSTWSKFKEQQNAEGSEADMVIATASDADSSGDGKVVANSVEGEDDIVDVTMKDAASNASANAAAMPPPELPLPNQPQLLRQFNSQRPKFIQPGEFLDPELQGLFELSYFANRTDGTVPTGWTNVDNNKTLPKLADRIPEDQREEEDQPSPESWNSTASGNEESSNEEENPQQESSQTRMTDESSEEDVPHGARTLARTGANRPQKMGTGGRKKFKNHKTYGKKGNKRRDKQMRAGKHVQRSPIVESEPTPPAVADGGPLIRLYEGLVVDWSEEAWEAVFGYTGKKQDASQGAKTFVDLETINDPALKISQRKRQSRRSRGITLDECLDEFERAEVLSEQDMWYCPRCKEHRRASKKFDLWKSPDYLVAHLKRFSSSGWRRDKLDVLVDFPIEGLDLTSRVIQKEEGKQEIYDLIAVDDHYGGLGGGHYTAYAKNFVDGRWYNYNDSSVSAVSDPSSVVTSAAYLLFYRRRTSGHLGGPRFAKIFEKYNTDTSGDDEGESDDGLGRTLGSSSGAPRTTIKSLSDSQDAELPPYEEAIRSIEDEGLGASGSYQIAAPKFDMTQSWSFKNLDGSGAEGSTAADYASDDAQFDSSADERGGSREDLFEADTHMASAGSVNGFANGEAPSPTGAHEEVLAVPTGPSGGEDEAEVAEIHIEGDNAARSE